MIDWRKTGDALVGWIAGRPLYAIVQLPQSCRLYVLTYKGETKFICESAGLDDTKELALRHYRQLVPL